MARSEEPNVSRLYHLHSSNFRPRLPELKVDEDRHPLRFRTYPAAPRIALPGRDFVLRQPLGTALEQRNSVREYTASPISLESVGRLLHSSYGVRGHRQVEGEWTYDRPSPSAGGRYPLEIYLSTRSVEKLDDGIYHYDARTHQLELRRAGLFQEALADMTLGQGMLCDANLVIVITAIFERTMWKYGQRGYRYVWLDAGHLGENIYLVAGALGLGACGIGGFFDQEVNCLLALPPEEESIYLIGIGQPRNEGQVAQRETEGSCCPAHGGECLA